MKNVNRKIDTAWTIAGWLAWLIVGISFGAMTVYVNMVQYIGCG